MILRPDYIEAVKPFMDAPLVKILTGVRRCGKSTIFEMIRQELLERGIPEDHIIMKKYTEMDIPDTITAKQMYDELVSRVEDDKRYYFLLDEIQEIKGWEKAVNSLLEGMNADIYVTGSNSKLMSSEISTYLTGRYISIPYLIKNIWNLKRRVHSHMISFWKNILNLVDFQSLRLANTNSSQHIRL